MTLSSTSWPRSCPICDKANANRRSWRKRKRVSLLLEGSSSSFGRAGVVTVVEMLFCQRALITAPFVAGFLKGFDCFKIWMWYTMVVCVCVCVMVGVGIAHWLERQSCDWKVPGSSRQDQREIFFLHGHLSVLTLISYPFHPCVTAVAHKRSQSFCQKCMWQVTAKHIYTLPMWLWMKWHCKLVHDWMVYTELAHHFRWY